MRLAVYHNLPSGGALRVLQEFLKHCGEHHDVELFLPRTANDSFLPLNQYAAKTHRFPVRIRTGRLSQYDLAREVPRFGKAISHQINHAGFDAALVSASQITQAPEILPFLKVPSLYYAPEHRRATYDPPVEPPPSGPKQALWQLVYGPKNRWLKSFDRRATRAATQVFAHSKFAGNIIQRIYGVNPAVIPLGVDTALYRPLRRKRKNFVLSVGALEPLKGHQFVIDAIGKLPQKTRPVLVVVGDRGGYGPELKRQAKRHGVDLTIRRGISFKQVVEVYNGAALLAAGQINEPFGLITLEAMATETPVVAVAEGGLKETVTDAKTGLLTKRDPEEFAAAMARVINNPTLAKRLGKAGRKDVEQRWQWPRAADKIDKLLVELTKPRQ